MNTDNLKQQQLFGEPQFVEGIAGKKQLPGEPQFVAGKEKHAEQLTPIYTELQHGRNEPYQTGQEQLHGVHTAPSGEEWQKIPIYSDKDTLYPGQEQFLGKYTTPGMDGKEHLSTGGTVHTGEHTHKSEHSSLSREKQQKHLPTSTEHVHLGPSEQFHLTPDAEHIHVTAGAPQAGVEQVIRIKPDGRIQVTAEKLVEHGTSTAPLQEHGLGTEHLQKEHVPHEEKLSTAHTKEHGTDYDTEMVMHKPHVEHETEHLHTQESKKKRLSDKARHHDTTETQTIVKIEEHEPGTAGYRKEEKLGKHHDDDTHHTRDIDTHQHGTDTTKVNVDKAHGDTEHVKGEHDIDTAHLKAGKTSSKKERRASDKSKHHRGTDETEVIVKKEKHDHGHGDYASDKSKHHGDYTSDKSKHHGADETKVIVDKDKRGHGTDKTEVIVKKEKHDHGDYSDKSKHHGDYTSDKSKHHHGTDDTKVMVDKDRHDHGDYTSDKTRHHRGTDEAEVIVKKEKHDHGHGDYSSDKSKRHDHGDYSSAKSRHHGTDDTKVMVDKDRHGHGDYPSDKTKHHHGTDDTKVKVDKDRHDHGDYPSDKTKHETEVIVKKEKHDHGHGDYSSDKSKHHDTTNTTHVKVGTISKPQDVSDRTESQGLLQQLRSTLSESDTPNMDLIGELLLRAEVLLSKSANQPNIDPDARKTLEDISTLLITAKQMERHKAIAERLQKISDECQKALTNVRGSDAPSTAIKSASMEAVDFINIWRPVFQLLIRSRDFRQLFVDSLRIAKRVLARNEGIVDDLSQKFIEGESTQGMKERVREHREESVNVKMTDEEWEYLQEQIINVLAVLARNPNYHDAINKLFTLLDMFSRKTKEAKPSSGDLETHARKAKMETEELVVSFTGRETLNQFKLRLRRLIRAINSDPELVRYSHDIKTFILCSKSEEEIRSEAFKLRTRELVDRGRYLMNKSKDRIELDEFLEAGNELLENIKNDEYVKELRTRAGIVRSDLTYVDSEGRTKIDVDMFVKLQTVLIPMLAETFKKIQIPRIESSEPKLDFWVDNIVLCGYDILPDNIKFHVERDTEVSIREFDSRGTHTRLVIHLEQLRTEVKNIEFYFKRKTFPSMSDSGIVTFRIPENGADLSIYFTVEERPGETHPRLTEGYAEFNIRKMDIEFDKTTLKHDVLIPMATPIMKPIIRSKIERAVENNLTNALQQLGERLTQALGELSRPPVFNAVKDTIKTSVPAQIFQERREKLE